jgi:hypothetical protein
MEVPDTEVDHALLRRVLELLPADKVLLRYVAEQVLAGVPAELARANVPLEVVLASMPPEQRLAVVPPEQRLADLDRDHQALALPLEILQLMPEEYLRSLAPAVELELRRRLSPNRR